MYPIMLPGPNSSNDGFSSFRNPDDLFPEQRGTPPDRLGTLFIRILETLSDGWDILQRRRTARAVEPDTDDAAKAATPVFHSR